MCQISVVLTNKTKTPSLEARLKQVLTKRLQLEPTDTISIDAKTGNGLSSINIVAHSKSIHQAAMNIIIGMLEYEFGIPVYMRTVNNHN